jgi:Flp pilus assembly protein TadD
MRPAHQFVAVVVVSLVGAAIVLSLGREQNSAVLAGEGQHKEAIALLERRLADAPHDPDLLAALGRSYSALGEVGRAIAALDAYLTVRPDDMAARERQADLLLQSGLVDRYLDAMARAVAAQPSAGRVTRLVELFRLHGRVDDEMATLQAYAGTAMLETAQLERLGALLAERGQWHAAKDALELADRKAPSDASTGRLLLLEVLIESNEVDEVYERARAWTMAWRSPYLCGKLILRMAHSGLHGPASRLALDCTDTMSDDTFDIAGLVAYKGHQDIARQMLVRWAERSGKPTERQIRAFVQVSAAIGDVSGPLVKLARLARSGADPATQGRMAEELAIAFGQQALVAVRPLLSNKVLLARPLFAAELSLFEGNAEMARWFLNRIEPAQLSAEQLADWLALLHRVETDADVFKRLAVLWDQGSLPAELAPHLADEAVKMGQVRTHDLIWNSVRR